MTQRIKIGQVEGKDLFIGINELINSRMVVQGSSGSGKSGVVRVLCERISQHIPFILFDPEGEYATLREKVDLILVGPRGDIPADLRAVEVLMRKLVEKRVSAVIDLSDMKIGAKREYMARAATALVELPKELWLPEAIIMDEVQIFCPERSSGQKDAVSTLPVIDLISRGRKRGYAIIPVTQRFSKVHNDALAELKNVFIGSCWLDADQKRAGDYLGLVGNDRRALREMPTRTFYCFGPALSIKGVSQVYIDKAESSFPKAGQIQSIKLPKASEAIGHILSQLDDLPEVAEQEKKDIASLRAENAELQRQLTARPTVPEPVEVEKEVEVPVLPENFAANAIELADTISLKIATFVNELEVHVGEFDDAADKIRAAIEQVTGEKIVRPPVPPVPSMPRLAAVTRTAPPPPQKTAQNIPNNIPKPPTPRPTATVPVAGDVRLNDKQQKILDVLRTFEELGRSEIDRPVVAVFTGISTKSSGFRNYVSMLKQAGLLEYKSDNQLALTDAGRSASNISLEIGSLTELHAAWKRQLNGKQTEMVEFIIQYHPEPMTREELAAAVNISITSSGFRNYLSTLRTLGIVDYCTARREVDGDVVDLPAVKATELLFPEGLS